MAGKTISDLDSLGLYIIKNITDEPARTVIVDLIAKHGFVAMDHIDISKAIFRASNQELEDIIASWYEHLKDNMICPRCKKQLKSPDICKCGWREE